MKIESQILEILSNGTKVEQNQVRLICGQLERKTYLAVNKILEAMGGKWDRKTQAHVFATDIEDELDRVIMTGQIDIPKSEDFGFFETPKQIVKQMLEFADIKENMDVLEPSAGRGSISDELRLLKCNLDVIELLEGNRKVLTEKGYNLIASDFLTYKSKTYHRIVQNPPFAKQADVDHVMHAYDLLKPQGKLVSIMSAGAIFRENKKTMQFRKILDSNGKHERLPENSFKESGTSVNTILVVLEK